MDVQDFLPLAPRDLLILAVLTDGPSHGYGLIKEVERRSESGVLLDPANLYRVLRRMRGLGWIEEPTSDQPRRRVYRITDKGRAVVSAELTRLERLLGQVRPALASGPQG